MVRMEVSVLYFLPVLDLFFSLFAGLRGEVTNRTYGDVNVYMRMR